MTVDVLQWEGLLQEVRLNSDEVAHLTTEPEREARFAPLPESLDPRVREAIGVPQLYAHQRAAWDAAARGENVMVTTGTASGKTLAFNLPVLDALAREPKTRALYLYPTKALAQDQFRTLSGYRIPKLKPAIYDGDTPTEQRWQIRKWSNVILTNPDMVHVGLLPNHDRWGDVLANLRYVVVDEAHVYRGVFGSHVANVLRRLRRLARVYGSEPQFLLASATISNPGELGASLLGAPVTVVGDDAAPRAERTILLWNPPLLDEEMGLRGSALAEAAKLQASFVERGLRTLTFAKSRKAAELIHRFTAERLGDDAHLSPYRAGYTAQQRREIERRLSEGDLLGVSATNALELGIDVGLLDAVISVGFPGNDCLSATAVGHARGAAGSGLAVLVASEDGLDQFFMREPDKLLGRRVEAAILDHANPRVLAGHVRAAAYEAPLTDDDAAILGPEALDAARDDPELKQTPAGIVWAGKEHPAARRSRCAPPSPTRSASSTAARARCSASSSARARTRRCTKAPSTCTWASRSSCASSNLNTMYAVVEPFNGNWYTQAKKDTMTQIVEPRRSRVAARDGGLLRRDRGDRAGRRLRAQDDLARRSASSSCSSSCRRRPSRRRRSGTCPSPHHLAELDEMPKLLGTLHAAEHAMIALLPLWAMCDRWDIGGLSTNIHPETGRPTVFIYDGHPGGVGITERGFEQFEGWVADTAAMIRGCPCSDGCPSCVQSPKCGNLNDMLDKAGALTFLSRLR